MNYEEMSDFEVNGYVSMHMHGFSWIEFVDGYTSYVKCGNERSPGFAMIEVTDYCNNPSDAWPIINSIFWELVRSDELGVTEWAKRIRADDGSDKLRAAMIVFLIIRGGKCQKS